MRQWIPGRAAPLPCANPTCTAFDTYVITDWIDLRGPLGATATATYVRERRNECEHERWRWVGPRDPFPNGGAA
jgi:hypothetical protein